MPWQQTEPRRVSPTRAAALRDEFGPAPWWDADRLGELVRDRGLTAVEIADVFRVHPDTVRERIRRYRETEWSA